MLVRGVLEGVQLLHVRLCILLSHDFDCGREELIAPGVVAMGVRVDDVRDWFQGHRFDLVQDRLTIVASFVSTSTTPLAVTKTALLPPAPGIM